VSTLTPLPGPEAALVGLAALAVVTGSLFWPPTEHFNAMAHEGAHAVTGSVVGLRVRGVQLNRNATGGTVYRTRVIGPRGVLTAFVGYLGPSLFGLGAAKLITRGHIIAVLWVTVIFLVLLLSKLSPASFGFFSVPVAIALLYALIRYASAGTQVVMAYGMTWLLLLSGVRVAVQDGANAVDAGILSKITYLPRQLWAVLWLAGTVLAVVVGVRLLVLGLAAEDVQRVL